jgi:ParB family chromosome partitioning protein
VTTPSGKRGGLGRGLGALIPSGPPPVAPAEPTNLGSQDESSTTVPGPVAGARFAALPLESISANRSQPRTAFDADDLAELAHSIREVGLLQPVVVRPLGDDRYELVMGERRWRAAREAGLEAVPAIIRETGDDAMLRDALLENLHRSQLNPLEEAAAYAQLLEDFAATHEELARRIGRSRPQISNTLRLLQLPPAVQRRVAAGVVSAGHARAVLGLPDEQAQEAMATRIVAEGMSVRAAEEAVSVLVQDEPRSPRAARGKRLVPEQASEVAQNLSDRLETRVRVDVGRSRGRLTIEFATMEDLQRIAAIVQGPDEQS